MDRMTCDRAFLWVCFVALLGKMMVRKCLMPCGPMRYRVFPCSCCLMLKPRKSKPGVPSSCVRVWVILVLASLSFHPICASHVSAICFAACMALRSW